MHRYCFGGGLSGGKGFLASYRLNNFFFDGHSKRRNFVSWEYRGFRSPIFLLILMDDLTRTGINCLCKTKS